MPISKTTRVLSVHESCSYLDNPPDSPPMVLTCYKCLPSCVLFSHTGRLRKIFSNDFDHPETIFHAVFGKKCYTWSFSGDFTFRSSESGFEWREKSDWTNQRTEEWEPSSESELVDESYAVGSCSDRAILGLPPTGRLKLEDVKKAFRLSSLKWHPDKHQGPSQAMAEEKFKTCVAAYKSLCNALA
ncbi:uncharacterized protein LOC108481603 [Gossypium arboreum]|uniref:uncharacterized protein LOC108481603 n=1 Tax=Gossypium arboreum TaxID=29729 RepID=UPI0022F1A1D8|nr:uncharacterized protein LOC108481603 [Gossypium arboreum]